MNEIEREYKRRFNRATGTLLKRLRETRKRRRREVVADFPELTISRLKEYELGRVSPPAHVFYNLIEWYGGNWPEVESALLDVGAFPRQSSRVFKPDHPRSNSSPVLALVYFDEAN
jgi:hypothetical protein